VAMRLGHFDGEACPYAAIGEEALCTEEAKALSLLAAQKANVLLKNDGLLPLEREQPVALVGPMADTWFQDWYGGEPPYRRTLADGLRALEAPFQYADGWDRVQLCFGGKAARIAEDGTVILSDEGDVFVMECWGEDCYAFRCVRTGTYLTMTMPDGPTSVEQPLAAERKAAFNWFVLEVFHLEKRGDETLLLNRFHWPVEADGAVLTSGRKRTGTPVTIRLVEDGVAASVRLAKEAPVAVVAVGSHSLIPAKEEYDRHTLRLPEHQQRLLDAVSAANPNTVLVLLSNYPYTLGGAEERVPAILHSATGSQDMGTAVAQALYGCFSPAGRLNMTWYRSDENLGDVDDYDIIRGGRTYRYFEGKPLFPFGHGLTYSSFAYEGLTVEPESDALRFSLRVTNTGSRISDEVVQLYGIAPASRVRKPLRQLLAFTRLGDVQPGETRQVSFAVPVDELRFYDVISRRLMVEAGEYRFFAGPSSAMEAQSVSCFVAGEQTGKRELTAITPADHYDDHTGITILQGTLGYSSIAVAPGRTEAEAVYRDCRFDEAHCLLSLRTMSVKGGSLRVLVNGQEIGCWQGDTRTSEHRSAPPMDRFADEMIRARAKERRPIWEDLDFLLPEGVVEGTLTLCITGDVQVSFFRAAEAPEGRKIHLGIAN